MSEISATKRQAVEFFNRAVTLQGNEPLMCYKLLVSAVEADPELPQAWEWLADQNLNHQHKLRASGIACLRKTVEYDPNNAKAWTTLGHALYHSGHIEEAEKATRRAIDLDQNLANPWTNLSLCQSVQGRIKESLRSAERGYQIDPNPVTEMALGFACLHARDLKRGMKHFEAKLSYAHQVFHSMPWPRWQGEDLTGKTIFVLADQGMGDTLDFMRFIPMVAKKAETVVMQIQKEMLRMAGFMLADYPNVHALPMEAPFPQADFWCQNTSLPVALDLSTQEIENCPQLLLDLSAWPVDTAWKSQVAKLNIGIAWKGNPANDIDIHRSMKIEDFLPLYRVPDIQMYSLQVGQFAPEVHATGSAALVRDLSPYIRDTLDCALLMNQLDLVIAVESFIPHLANAVGKKVLMPYAVLGGDWRVGRKGSRMLWHEHTEVFHQGEDRQWAPVIDKICKYLTRRLAS